MKLKQRVPLFRWSFWRMAASLKNITTTGQVGDGREAAVVEYVLANARKGDVGSVLDTIDRFAYEESFLINVGDEKGELLDAAVRRANPKLALELGTYCGYGALRIAAAAPTARRVFGRTGRGERRQRQADLGARGCGGPDHLRGGHRR